MPSPFKKFLSHLKRSKKTEVDEDPDKLEEKYTHFRILVIGRANAGKTTLLKRVCDTVEDPCIYDENNKNLIEPTAERGIHDINRPFSFRSNPRFIFHDSPGFEAGGENELLAVKEFIEERSKASNVNDQLHAIWFCFIPDASRPLLELERRFFNEQRNGGVPVIALFTKFDDLISQVWDLAKTRDENIKHAEQTLAERFESPLREYQFPPRAFVRFEDLHEDTGTHQQQVKVLIDQTAASLDITALRRLFVSVQRNNLEVCVKYAIKEASLDTQEKLIATLMRWFPHWYHPSHNYERERGRLRDDIWWRDDIDLFPLLPMFFPHEDTLPNVADIAGLLICLENSFWMMKDANFKASFEKSCNAYKAYNEQIEIEVDADVQGYWKTKENQDKLFSIVIANLLPRPQ